PGLRARLATEVGINAGHDLQHRGLARDVEAEQADLGAREERQRDVLDDRAVRLDRLGHAVLVVAVLRHWRSVLASGHACAGQGPRKSGSGNYRRSAPAQACPPMNCRARLPPATAAQTPSPSRIGRAPAARIRSRSADSPMAASASTIRATAATCSGASSTSGTSPAVRRAEATRNQAMNHGNTLASPGFGAAASPPAPAPRQATSAAMAMHTGTIMVARVSLTMVA